jgi:hypothetical protein
MISKMSSPEKIRFWGRHAGSPFVKSTSTHVTILAHTFALPITDIYVSDFHNDLSDGQIGARHGATSGAKEIQHAISC